MTDFFQHQDNARGRTRKLVILFAAAVLLVIGLVYVLAGFATNWRGGWWNPSLLLTCSSIAGGVIFAGSGFKMLQLSAGGSVVARELGGRQIDQDTRDPDERRLLNIVEEMSLASGVPVPQVWVMDHEAGINAFAAGKSISDAVIGVTRGCLMALDRDEMQGVIAHEFSHILNGDMRLNLRLIGVVHGILVIALIGEGVMRVGAEMRGGKNNPGPILMIAGALVMGIGWLGVLLGRMIKSAVSRQREFLADASAVQFTRNPWGIGRALMKIGGYTYGSRVRTVRAEEASHMMFGAIKAAGMFDSHPPLAQRISAILPDWDGKMTPNVLPQIRAAAAVPHPRVTAREPKAAPWDRGGTLLPAAAAEIIARVGAPGPADMAQAVQLRDSIPAEVMDLMHEPAGAQAVIFGLLLEHDAEHTALTELVDEATLRTARHTAELVRPWHSSHAISLIDLAIPALRRMSREEYGRFSVILRAVIDADRQVDLFEFMVQRVVRRHLDLWFTQAGPQSIRYRSFRQLQPELEIILSAMCGVGRRSPEEGAAALAAAQQSFAHYGVYVDLRARPAGLAEVDAAVEKFDAATPLLKKQLLTACATAAQHDGTISDEEAELLRAVADSIGCPMPLLAAAGSSAA